MGRGSDAPLASAPAAALGRPASPTIASDTPKPRGLGAFGERDDGRRDPRCALVTTTCVAPGLDVLVWWARRAARARGTAAGRRRRRRPRRRYHLCVGIDSIYLYVHDTKSVAAAGEAASLLDAVQRRAGQESEIPNFKGSFLGRFPLVLADFWTSDRLSERSRSVDAFFRNARARGTLALKRR